MIDPISLALQVIASVVTMISTWKMGDKDISGPKWGIFSQVFWWGLMWYASLWGLLIINVAMMYIHIRNLILWSKEEGETK